MDDPRLTPARPDLAAAFLQGRIAAARYAAGEEFELIEALAPLRHAPAADAMLLTQALLGERVMIYDRDATGFAWGQLQGDSYVGWLPAGALARPGAAPTHHITALRTFAFPGPSIKLPPIDTLPMESTITVTHEHRPFAVTDRGWHVPLSHIAPVACHAADFVAVAERFIGTPYLWGGKSSLGIDCSGLLQLSLQAAGTRCPRDSDMQQRALGTALDPTEHGELRRGDLIFWQGHVAIVRDFDTLIHANAHHMATAIEPIRDAVARIAASGSRIAAIKRMA
jgi:cell wall-associated NlpC family hydrolase